MLTVLVVLCCVLVLCGTVQIVVIKHEFVYHSHSPYVYL